MRCMTNKRTEIIEKLTERGYEAIPQDVVKNGETFYAIAIGTGDVRPNIYVEEYLESLSLDEAVDECIRIYEAAAKTPTVFNKNITKWEYVREHLMVCVQKKSAENLVKRDFLDLEQYLRVKVMSENDLEGSYKVLPEHLKIWGVDESTIFGAAWNCTKPTFIAEDIHTFVNEYDSQVPMIVLCNNRRFQGASTICDIELLDSIATEYDSDLVILPSSIHEIICIPFSCFQIEENDLSLEKSRRMVQEINDAMVAPEERLSYNLYFYDKEKKEVSIK